MNNLKHCNFALFFTRGLSLSKWDELGMLHREIKIYQELSTNFKTIYFFTYGTNDMSYVSILPPNIVIVERPRWIPPNMYSVILPFVQRSILRKVHIVKTNQMDGSWAAVIAKKIYKVKLVVRCGYEWLSFIEKGKRANWKKVLARIVENFAYVNANKIIVTSKEDREFIIERFKVLPSPIIVIPNYIDTQKFKPLTVAKEQDRILFLGRFEDQKNLANLVVGMSGLPCRLVMIGNGSQKEQLIHLAKKHGVTIDFLGNITQDTMPVEMCKSKVFVLPSLYEGNPKALLEAMSCGLPCIGSRVSGIESIIVDEINGILCEIDSESIRKSILKVLNNSELSEKIGNGARTTIIENFSLEKVLESETNLYTSL